MNPVELNLFAGRITSICDEMGVVLRRTAFSPNIKDRLDFSCALFSAAGELYAQAAHIPVHLGSMAYAMEAVVERQSWQPGDMLVLNDPFLGGTHLPDVTLVAPVFQGRQLLGFVANRAHHANIGCDSPGSMPISTHLDEEGLLISPQFLLRAGELQPDALKLLCGDNSSQLSGDFAAQLGANHIGVLRLQQLLSRIGIASYLEGMRAVNDYADRLADAALSRLTPGCYSYVDYLDGDGVTDEAIALSVKLTVKSAGVTLDFRGSDDQVAGNLNCPRSVAAAAAYYAMRCLMPEPTPACAGAFRRIELLTRPGSVLDAQRPAAVAAGNVETSSRLVDVIFGALAQALPEAIPAASQGTMNNLAMGYIDKQTGKRWDYYETIAGGTGASASWPGLDAVHSHMTNTLNTPVESLELHYPLRLNRYQIRRGSGGKGARNGGAGVVREYQFLVPAQVSLISERRVFQPWGLAGGGAGESGVNLLNGSVLPGKCSLMVACGDKLEIFTPGGGGHGVKTDD